MQVTTDQIRESNFVGGVASGFSGGRQDLEVGIVNRWILIYIVWKSTAGSRNRMINGRRGNTQGLLKERHAEQFKQSNSRQKKLNKKGWGKMAEGSSIRLRTLHLIL